jgi:hypothetical protein
MFERKLVTVDLMLTTLVTILARKLGVTVETFVELRIRPGSAVVFQGSVHPGVKASVRELGELDFYTCVPANDPLNHPKRAPLSCDLGGSLIVIADYCAWLRLSMAHPD